MDDLIPLAAEDRAILALKSPTIAGHTCKVVRLGEPLDIDRLRARMVERIALAPALASRLAAQYQRLRPRRGHKKALGAVKHSILCTIWHMLSNGELYDDLGGDYFRKRDPERTVKRLVAQLETLGHTVTLQEAVPA